MTTTTVTLLSLDIVLNVSPIFMAVELSSSPVGSSANSTAGLFTRALAIATLCCSPPDISWGLCSALDSSPTSAYASSDFRLLSLQDIPDICSLSSTFSWADRRGINPKD